MLKYSGVTSTWSFSSGSLEKRKVCVCVRMCASCSVMNEFGLLLLSDPHCPLNDVLWVLLLTFFFSWMNGWSFETFSFDLFLFVHLIF